MFIDPATLADDLPRLEEIEKVSMRLVTQAMVNFRDEAANIYARETDKPADIGEDITREALDRIGVSKIGKRLFGKMDYKRARYVFHPDYAIKQALFVESKAEMSRVNARLQITQTSMRVRQIRRGEAIDMQGMMPMVTDADGELLLTTTVLVKYIYREVRGDEESRLDSVIVAAIPNLMLQDVYNPTAEDGIWDVGPDSPLRAEKFRTRLSFRKLKAKSTWRVQNILLSPHPFTWDE